MTNTQADVKIRRNKGRSWSGNGFGHNSADYVIERDGQKVGFIENALNNGSDWEVLDLNRKKVAGGWGFKYRDARQAGIEWAQGMGRPLIDLDLSA